MADWLVVEEFRARDIRLRSGTVISDESHDVMELRRAGLVVVPLRGDSQLALVNAYRSQSGPDAEGDLLPLLQSFGQADLPASGLTPPTLRETKIVYVSQAGNDETGDGSRVRPYATVRRAILDMPTDGFDGDAIAFAILVVPPYTDTRTQVLALTGVKKSNAAVNNDPMFLLAPLANPANQGTPQDERWEILKGPLSPLTAGLEHGRAIYTFTGGTFGVEDEDLGFPVRVFSSTGAEKFRGMVSFQRTATQALVIQTALNAAVVAPATSDTVYVCRSRVRLGGCKFIGHTEAWVCLHDIEFGPPDTATTFDALQLYHRAPVDFRTYVLGCRASVVFAFSNCVLLQGPDCAARLGDAGFIAQNALDAVPGYSAAEQASMVHESGSAVYIGSPHASALSVQARVGSLIRVLNLVTRGQIALGADCRAQLSGTNRLNGVFTGEIALVEFVPSASGQPFIVTNARPGLPAFDLKDTTWQPAANIFGLSLVIDAPSMATSGPVIRLVRSSMFGDVEFIPLDAGSPTLPGTAILMHAVVLAHAEFDAAGTTVVGPSADVQAGTNAAITLGALIGAGFESDPSSMVRIEP